MGQLLRAVLYTNPIIGPSMRLLDLAGNTVFDGPIEDAQTFLTESLDTVIQTVGDGFGELADALGELGADIGSGILGIIRYLGVAVIEGMEDTYGYIAGKVGGKKVQVTSSVTVLGIFMFTAFYILNRLPGRGE